MATFASTGAFSTLRSNQGMLNTKRAKSFLLNDNLIRFKGKNIQINSKREFHAEDKARNKKLIRQLNNSESQKNLLILAVSILSALLGVAII